MCFANLATCEAVCQRKAMQNAQFPNAGKVEGRSRATARKSLLLPWIMACLPQFSAMAKLCGGRNWRRCEAGRLGFRV